MDREVPDVVNIYVIWRDVDVWILQWPVIKSVGDMERDAAPPIPAPPPRTWTKRVS